MDLCLTGRFIDSVTALSWGLVSDVVAPEKLLDHGKNMLLDILSMAPLAVAGVMETINRGYDMTLKRRTAFRSCSFC